MVGAALLASGCEKDLGVQIGSQEECIFWVSDAEPIVLTRDQVERCLDQIQIKILNFCPAQPALEA